MEVSYTNYLSFRRNSTRYLFQMQNGICPVSHINDFNAGLSIGDQTAVAAYYILHLSGRVGKIARVQIHFKEVRDYGERKKEQFIQPYGRLDGGSGVLSRRCMCGVSAP